MNNSSEILLSARNISKAYPQGTGQLEILREISLDIKKGEALCIVGASGAGKSTLTAALAQAGFGVFSDDVLPVFYANAGRAHGAALGIAPRLRLPLPQTAGPEFEHWVATVSGPSNRQYRYLAIADQPRHGKTLPIGAFVILDRQEEPVAATLSSSGRTAGSWRDLYCSNTIM